MKGYKRPKYLKTYRDIRGKHRCYFSPPGGPQTPLPAFEARDFMEAYRRAYDEWTRKSKEASRTIGSTKMKPGTMEALIMSYYSSVAYQTLAPITQRTYRNTLERIRKEFGSFGVSTLKRVHVDRILAKKSAKPEVANAYLKMLKLLMRHALTIGLRETDPTVGIRRLKSNSTGYKTWSEQDIAKFYAAHPEGSRARLAFDLLLYTGLRRGDVVQLGHQHVQNDYIVVRQSKTGEVVNIRVHDHLRKLIDSCPRDRDTFLITEQGRAFTPAGFGNWMRDRINEADLRADVPEGKQGLSVHGLRKAILRRLAEAGCSANEIIAISGHKNITQVTRYTQEADRKRLSQKAIEAIASTMPSVK